MVAKAEDDHEKSLVKALPMNSERETCEKGKGSDTTRSPEVTHPSTDVSRDLLISKLVVELDGSLRRW